MSGQKSADGSFEYEKLAAYSLLLSEALFEVLKSKGLLTHDEVTRHMEKLNNELRCRPGGVEFIKKTN